MRTCPEAPRGVGSERPMESPLTLGSQTPEEHEERQAALDRGRAVPAVPRRRRPSAHLQPRASRRTRSRSAGASRPTSRCPGTRRPRACTPSSRYRAGEWTICDDGWSQNGTWVNGLRLAGRRRLADGDLVKIGRTIIGFHQPGATGPGPTMVAGRAVAPRRASPSSSSASCARSASRCSPTATASTRRATSRSPTRRGSTSTSSRRSWTCSRACSGSRTCRGPSAAPRSRCWPSAPGWSAPTRAARRARR